MLALVPHPAPLCTEENCYAPRAEGHAHCAEHTGAQTPLPLKEEEEEAPSDPALEIKFCAIKGCLEPRQGKSTRCSAHWILRGFARLSQEDVVANAKRGSIASLLSPSRHHWSKEEAAEAGRKGGLVCKVKK